MATLCTKDAITQMNIGISMEMTRVLRDTWHAALNHEWYDVFAEHTIVPLCCHDTGYRVHGLDLVVLAGGNDMPDIVTWRNNHYPKRDDYERNLVNSCWQSNIPVVGVCRGAHFINWLCGGTHKLMSTPYDNVKTQLSSFEVTCHHSIQIDQLAPGFEILEQDPNGVVELSRSKSLRMLGVGWHPERAVNKHTRPRILELINTL